MAHRVSGPLARRRAKLALAVVVLAGAVTAVAVANAALLGVAGGKQDQIGGLSARLEGARAPSLAPTRTPVTTTPATTLPVTTAPLTTTPAATTAGSLDGSGPRSAVTTTPAPARTDGDRTGDTRPDGDIAVDGARHRDD